MHTDIHDQSNRTTRERLSLYETVECCRDDDDSCGMTTEADESDMEDVCCC